MKQLFKDWYKRAEFFWYWHDPKDVDSPKPVSFAVDMFVLDMWHLHYFDTFDKNRWRKLHFQMNISRFAVSIEIPYKRLPDYVPSDKVARLRGIHNR